MVTYKTKTNPNVLEAYNGDTLLETSQPLNFEDWAGFVFWAEHFVTSIVWDADFLYQCYQQDKLK